ncbi:MAG TPA: glycosyltransferase family 1 protein [Ferruginibacter sp.]|nr:glycosyltransferase family 1 protein [Ferruginibacter sp.]
MMNTKKIKIFVDAHPFDTTFQGTQTFIEGLYNVLLQNHPQLDIYFGAYHVDRIQKAFPFLAAANILQYKKRKFSFIRFLIDIPQLIKKHSFDFAHFQYVSPAPSAHCKYIVTLHDILFNDFPEEFSWMYRIKRNFIFKKSIRNAAIKTTVSSYSRDRIALHYKIPGEQLYIIPNAVNTSTNIDKEAARLIIKEKYGIENFILYVSRVEPRKNHLLLLNKFFELELYKQNISLIFIGERSMNVPELDNKIAALTNEQQNKFYHIGQVNKTDLGLFYQSCKLFVYPSKAEGFGIPPLEAAINKAPVLCSNATAMSDFTFFDPYMFDPENDNEFNNKLKEILGATPTVSQLEMIAATITEKYSWDKTAAIFLNLLQSNRQ